MISLLLPVSDWSMIMIGPWDFLSVASRLFAVLQSQIQFYGWAWKLTKRGCETVEMLLHRTRSHLLALLSMLLMLVLTHINDEYISP
jgi:hypothetical protein